MALLQPCDHQGLLNAAPAVGDDDDIDLDALTSDLEDMDAVASGITELKHVRPVAEKRAAEEIANRETCADFDRFKPLFAKVQSELDAGLRTTRPPETSAEIEAGRFYILSGQKAYVAEVGETFKQDYGDWDARLRVVFDNGTESNLLMRSLHRAMSKDKSSRTISDPIAGPLFTDASADGDEASGIIYVLRSKSNLPVVSDNRDLLHKIGVTGGSVERRIANAKLDPTFLMADVEIVTTYELNNINRVKLENLLHRIFERARLDIEIKIKDRFGHPFPALAPQALAAIAFQIPARRIGNTAPGLVPMPNHQNRPCTPALTGAHGKSLHPAAWVQTKLGKYGGLFGTGYAFVGFSIQGRACVTLKQMRIGGCCRTHKTVETGRISTAQRHRPIAHGGRQRLLRW